MVKSREAFHAKLSKGSSRKSLTSNATRSSKTFSTAKRLAKAKARLKVNKFLQQAHLFSIHRLNAMAVAKHQLLVPDTSAAFAKTLTSAQHVKREETILIHS